MVINPVGDRLLIAVTYLADEDEGGAAGWSVSDARYEKVASRAWSPSRYLWENYIPIVKMALLAG